MFTRLRWFLFGASSGVGASVWLQRRWRRRDTSAVRTAAAVTVKAVRRPVRAAGARLAAATSEGRAARAAKEAELRSMLEGEVPDSRVIELRPHDRHPSAGERRSPRWPPERPGPSRHG